MKTTKTIRVRTGQALLPSALLIFSMALAGAPLLVPATVHAADLAAVSQITGIEIPAGAVPFHGADGLFNGVLNSLAGEESVKRKPRGSAEVFAWQGDRYRENRVAFTRTALKRALTSAGYTVQDISPDDIRETNIFAHFDPEDKNLPFRPTVLKRPEFFRATNEGKGISIVGAWIQSDDAMALGILPVEFKGAPKSVPLPEVSGGNVVLVKDINDTMKGLPPAKMPAFEKIAPRTGRVRGLVKDSQGRPIAGAEVAVFCSAGGGFRTTHKGRSNAQGLYEVLLPTGIAEVAEARCKVNYNGAEFDLRLFPVSGELRQFDARAGHVENFVLRTEGEYGGTIRALHNNSLKGTIEITITPVGRLFDGSTGRTFVYRYPANEGTEKFLNGMPLGRYKLTARVIDEGDALPLQVRRTFGTDAEREPGDSITVDFTPGNRFSMANHGKSNSGVVYFEVTLEP